MGDVIIHKTGWRSEGNALWVVLFLGRKGIKEGGEVKAQREARREKRRNVEKVAECECARECIERERERKKK